MSFVYDIHHSVPTGYEPISRRASWKSDSEEGLWIGEVMKNLGYPSSSGSYYFTQVSEYLNKKRNAFKTDWAFAVFVVDSLNDVDGKFSNEKYAYAYLKGPFMVMTYDNNGWGIDLMQEVMAHETGHIWGAEDEYATSGCKDTDTGGYLNIANTNCENGDPPTEDSIMRGTIFSVSQPSHLYSCQANGGVAGSWGRVAKCNCY